MPPEATASVQSILVVDDQPANRALIEGHLVAAGYAVSTAESGQQAIRRFQEGPLDLVLLDVLMPGMTGFETCRQLRMLPEGPSTPIVFVTALTDLTSHRLALESGGDDYLTKPINRVELLIRVKSLLRIKRMGSELQASADLIRGQRDALLTAQKQKEALIGLVVHDLKNPLMVIMGSTSFAMESPGLSSSLLDDLDRVRQSADEMFRMVMNLLDISRSEEGTLIPRPEEFDLRTLIEGVCQTMKRRLSGRNLELNVKLEPVRVQADADLLRRLIENLLDNCIKYAPPGGTMRIEARSIETGSVEIRVADQGPGVPPAYREKIFQRYVQLDRDVGADLRTSRGLGLTFCRLAAEAHGGRIWVEENQPQGSVFCVLLPCRLTGRCV